MNKVRTWHITPGVRNLRSALMVIGTGMMIFGLGDVMGEQVRFTYYGLLTYATGHHIVEWIGGSVARWWLRPKGQLGDSSLSGWLGRMLRLPAPAAIALADTMDDPAKIVAVFAASKEAPDIGVLVVTDTHLHYAYGRYLGGRGLLFHPHKIYLQEWPLEDVGPGRLVEWDDEPTFLRKMLSPELKLHICGEEVSFMVERRHLQEVRRLIEMISPAQQPAGV